MGLLSIAAPSYAAVINQVQKGTVTLAAGSGAVTQAITTVDLTKSFLVFSIRTNSNRPGGSQIGGRITATNLLTFDRVDVGGAPVVIIDWQVFEFTSGVTVQRGVAANVPNAGTNVAITVVNLTNSFVTVNMQKDGGQ